MFRFVSDLVVYVNSLEPDEATLSLAPNLESNILVVSFCFFQKQAKRQGD